MIRPAVAIVLLACATRSAPALGVAERKLDSVAGSCSARAPSRALPPTRFHFPRDDGAHDGYASETWRTFGMLASRAGDRFDVSVTVSRFAVGTCGPQPTSKANAWHTRHILSLAYQILDERTGHSERAVRVEREGPNGALADVGPLRLRVGLFRLERVRERATESPAYSLTLTDGKTSLVLREIARRAALPLGENGVVRTGSCADCSAYAYAYPHSRATGELRISGTTSTVSGDVWFDHEYARRELAPGDRGWTRFDVAFDDGRLLDARFVRDGRSAVVAMSGAFVASNGSVTYLHDHDAHAAMPPITPWYSRASSVSYPSAWLLGVPTETPVLAVNEIEHDQEIAPVDRAPYVMGPIEVEKYGPPGGDRGHGFVELTGYATPVTL